MKNRKSEIHRHQSTSLFRRVAQNLDGAKTKAGRDGRYNTSDFYTRLSKILGDNSTNLHGLLYKASREIASTLGATSAFFFIGSGEKLQVTVGEGDYTKLPHQDIEVVRRHIEDQGDAIIETVRLGKDEAHLRRLLVSHKVSLLVPLVHNQATLGLLALGERSEGDYRKSDVKNLATIAGELAIAINYALVIQEIKETNEHLEQKIDAATKELRSKNMRLQRLDETKDEFLSMASHQLRTPLTSIKGYLSMVLDGDAGKVPTKQRKLLEEAFNGSERMVRLIHDFLNVSRLQTGKFTLEYRQCDIVKMVKNEVHLMESSAKSRGIKLVTHTELRETMLYLDENKTRQVVMNIIDNAIYYSNENSEVEVTLRQKSDWIEFLVTDNGIGIPPGERSAIFSEFYRASNARQQRPDGTGVGLFLARKVIAAQGGEVNYSPRKGGGSVFGFKLPLSLAKNHP